MSQYTPTPVPTNIGPAYQTTVAIGSSSTNVAVLYAYKVYALFQNIGANDVWIAFSNGNGVVNGSFLLKANGGSIEFSDYIPTGSVGAVCASGQTSSVQVFTA